MLDLSQQLKKGQGKVLNHLSVPVKENISRSLTGTDG
jgi:hypothetical protein